MPHQPGGSWGDVMVSGSNVQRGSFALGLVVGLLIGLALALGVAVYVTKVPVPFVDKVPQRNAGQDAADAEKNRNWDPNAPLASKGAGRSASGVIGEAPPAAAPVVPAPAPAQAPTAAVVAPASAPALINPSGLGGVPARPANQATGSAAAAASAAASAAAARSDAGQYLVQVGAYARTDDAEQQRAKLAIAGLVARVSERDQAGKVMYRVRLGPFDTREEADAAREQAVAAGYAESTLVRAPR
jgi:cell division protein FtsN